MTTMNQESPPWGNWEVLDERKNFKVKRIEVFPGKRLSLQKHLRRREYWRVVQGKALVTLDGKEISLQPWDGIEIPAEAAHRIKNDGDENLVFIEIQQGDYLGEDDIVRLEDDFGRL